MNALTIALPHSRRMSGLSYIVFANFSNIGSGADTENSLYPWVDKREGTAEAHGAAFGVEDVANMKRAFGFNPDESFVIGDAVRQFFQGLPSRGEEYVNSWNGLLERYSHEFPELAAKFHSRVKGELNGWEQLVPKTFSDQPTATRASSGMVFNPIAKEVESFMVGTADLSPSVNLIWPRKVDFQHVSSLFSSTVPDGMATA